MFVDFVMTSNDSSNLNSLITSNIEKESILFDLKLFMYVHSVVFLSEYRARIHKALKVKI